MCVIVMLLRTVRSTVDANFSDETQGAEAINTL